LTLSDKEEYMREAMIELFGRKALGGMDPHVQWRFFHFWFNKEGTLERVYYGS